LFFGGITSAKTIMAISSEQQHAFENLRPTSDASSETALEKLKRITWKDLTKLESVIGHINDEKSECIVQNFTFLILETPNHEQFNRSKESLTDKLLNRAKREILRAFQKKF